MEGEVAEKGAGLTPTLEGEWAEKGAGPQR
jgi:hypothetical protein